GVVDVANVRPVGVFRHASHNDTPCPGWEERGGHPSAKRRPPRPRVHGWSRSAANAILLTRLTNRDLWLRNVSQGCFIDDARREGPPMAAEDAGSTVPRRQLGRYLRQLRGAVPLTVKAAAESLEWSPVKIWRIESGQTGMRALDVEAMCRTYGAAD